MKITSTITHNALAHCLGIEADAILRCDQTGRCATGGVRYEIETAERSYIARYHKGQYERLHSLKRSELA